MQVRSSEPPIPVEAGVKWLEGENTGAGLLLAAFCNCLAG